MIFVIFLFIAVGLASSLYSNHLMSKANIIRLSDFSHPARHLTLSRSARRWQFFSALAFLGAIASFLWLIFFS